MWLFLAYVVLVICMKYIFLNVKLPLFWFLFFLQDILSTLNLSLIPDTEPGSKIFFFEPVRFFFVTSNPDSFLVGIRVVEVFVF